MLALAASLLHVPYRAYGRDLKGWDCLGYAMHFRCLIERPWRSLEASSLALGAESAEVAAARIAARMGDWTHKGVTACDASPGDLLLFERFGFARHIAIALEEGWFTHADQGVGTEILPLSGRWASRLRGVFD